MVRGTRILIGNDAQFIRVIESQLLFTCGKKRYKLVSFPNISEAEIFKAKADEATMYTFKDKGNRELCLNPEITALVQQEYKNSWLKSMSKPVRIMYVQRCYRYDRPQAGRYREFTQFGIELLGGVTPEDKDEVTELLHVCLKPFNFAYKFVFQVKRGLGYYVEDGFEAEVEELGAQKQLAGGGRYDCGIGWAIGLERLIAAQELTLGASKKQ